MSSKAQFPDEQLESGEFVRQDDAFQDWVSRDGSSGFLAEAGRYHLYVSWACPWAHRTIIFRHLKGLESVVSMSVVDPVRDDLGWRFTEGEGHGADPVNGFKFLSEAYLATDSHYKGRVTVPVLWDRTTKRIVSNSDDDLLRIFNAEFDAFANSKVDLCPPDLRSAIDALNDRIYQNVNNGVYRAGFATSQAAYEAAVYQLFATLDELETGLENRRFLFGSQPLETDWRLFVTLIRFDAVYFGHFKCNLRRIVDYPNLFGYLCDLYNWPGVAETVNFDHIKRHYYYTHDDINPTRIVPVGPIQDFSKRHDRERLGS
ncbi:MAG: glutathione S-transferase family protein [Verrucomicrobia bacterium]|nr:glutathione S-transferase family protein [Verrucomicrobiota bacterium]